MQRAAKRKPPPGTEDVINLCDDDDPVPAAAPASSHAPVAHVPVTAPASIPSAPVSAPASAHKMADAEAASFSGDEDEGGEQSEAPKESEDAEGWETLGYDFSGKASADASQTTCKLCNRPLELSWDSGRKEIVVLNAVMMAHQIYHMDCANTRIPPCNSPLVAQPTAFIHGLGNGGEEA